MRKPRLDFPGARHHVMNRGARRQGVFTDEATRRLFLDILAELPDRFGVRIHGYALMPNHFHLMVESVTGELSRAMRHLAGEFSRRLNTSAGWDGPLFRGRFRNRVVGTEAYWRHLLLYVHLNPVRAGLTSLDLAAGTSHRAYLDPALRPSWLETDNLLRIYGGTEPYLASLRAAYEGTEKPPADFDAKRLWMPDPSGVVARPRKALPRPDAGRVLADICTVTGTTLTEILVSRQGRGGNAARWFAAWWMSRRAGLVQGDVCEVLAATHSVISQRVAAVERRWRSDPQLIVWVAAMEKMGVR